MSSSIQRASPFVCDAFVGGRLRYSNCAGASGPFPEINFLLTLAITGGTIVANGFVEAIGEEGWNQEALTGADVDYLRRTNFMYPAEAVNSIWPGMSFLLGEDHTATDVLKSNGETYYSKMAHMLMLVLC